MRFLLYLVIVLGAAGYFTNPAEDDLRGVLSQFVTAKVEEKVGGLPDLPTPPAGLPGVPGGVDGGGLKGAVTSTLTPAIMNQVGIRRDNYFLFSVFHLSVPSIPMEKAPPACVIGAFKFVFVPLQSC